MGDERERGAAQDREAILARRIRFVKLAIAGAAVATTQASCQPCLSPLHDAGPDARAADGGVDGGSDTGTP
ncbi:MAG: hypothetical protein U0234_06440 [Sandaracinus sp.]